MRLLLPFVLLLSACSFNTSKHPMGTLVVGIKGFYKNCEGRVGGFRDGDCLFSGGQYTIYDMKCPGLAETLVWVCASDFMEKK